MKQERKENHTAELWARCVYGIGYKQFASFDDSRVTARELPWTCPENPSFPWLDLDHLYIVDGDAEHANLSDANLVCEGGIINASLERIQNCAVRYAVVSSTDPDVFEFEMFEAFDIGCLTIHYKTMAKPGAPDLRLVTSVEYEGRQIYSSGSIVSDCEMPSGGGLGKLSCNGTICDGWHGDSLDGAVWRPLDVANTIRTLVVPAHVDVIDGEAFAGCNQLSRLYVKEGAERLNWHGQTAWQCVKVPGSLYCGFMDSETRRNSIPNFFFSGTGMNETEFLVKEDDGIYVRWLELKPSEFQYVCSLAFDMPREECELVGGRWLFTHSDKSFDLLIQLAAAFLEGREVEQDLQMALRCCEQACWCATTDEVPLTEGESFPGIEVAAVHQFGGREISFGLADEYERANKLKEEVLTHFQRLDIREFERRSSGSVTMYVIPDNAFEGRQDLRDVLLPDELRDKHVRLGARAFAHCANLRSISVPDVQDTFVLSRQANSFDGCDALSDRIQYSADGTKALFCLEAPERCVICDHVHAIADYAFAHSRKLSDFRWESSDDTCIYCMEPREIGISAFEGCNQLSCVFTGGKEVSLRSRAFASCRNLSLYRFGYGDIEAEDSGLPPAMLDVSGTSVFDGCEMLGFIEPGLGPDKGFLVLKEDAWRGCQFSGCIRLHILPPVICTSIPANMFADCALLHEVRCLATSHDVIKSVLSRKRPDVKPAEGGFSIGTRAFAGCNALERFQFCRLRASLRLEAWKSDVELIDDNPKQVLFEHEAFFDCNRLKRQESSFAGAMIGSDPSAFRGCPEFDGFVSE